MAESSINEQMDNNPTQTPQERVGETPTSSSPRKRKASEF